MKTIVSSLIAHLHLGLALLLLVATANGASAEETDTRQPRPCGGYYACIELQPSLPDTVLVPWSAQP
jgi:hypothetical protein